MKYDYRALLLEEERTILGKKYIPVIEGKYDHNDEKGKMIRTKRRGTHRSWVVPGESPVYKQDLPMYALTEENIFPLQMRENETNWDTATLNNFIEANVARKFSKGMGRPLSQQINIKVILMILGGIVLAIIAVNAFMGNKGGDTAGEVQAAIDLIKAVI